MPFLAHIPAWLSARDNPVFRLDRQNPGQSFAAGQMGPGRDARPHRKNAVVPVSEVSGLLLADTRAALQRALVRRPQSDPAIVFAYWMLMRAGDEPEARQ